jgi:hypothetical protein
MSDATAGILALGLVLFSLAIMASKTLAPVKAKPKGRVELEVQLPLLQRAMAQKVNVISVCAVVVLGGGALTSQRVISPLVGLLALFVMLALISKRQTLLITTQGMLVHNAAFRSWKDFDSMSVRSGKLVFHSPTKLASISVYIPSRRRDEVVGVVRQHLAPPRGRSTSSTAARRSKQHRVA